MNAEPVSPKIDVVRRMVRAYNSGKIDDVAEFIHPGYLNPGALEHYPDLRGPEAFAKAVQWLKYAFSADAELVEIGYEENGDWVRAKLALYGCHVGNLVGMPATGRRFSGEQVHLIRIVDGKIRDHRDWPDYLGTYRQLGEPWPESNDVAPEVAPTASPITDRAELTTLLRLGSLHTPMAVRVAATLRLVDHMLDGTTDIDALAVRTETHAPTLHRLIRHLVAIGILRSTGPNTYLPSELGLLLADDHPAGQRRWHDLTEAVARADVSFIHLLKAVRSGEPTYASVYGRPFYDDITADAELGQSLDDLLACDQQVAYDAPAAAVDWTGVEQVLDVGGGNGGFAAAICRTAPQVRVTILEQSRTGDAARKFIGQEGFAHRVDVLVGDFFEPLPIPADVVILSFVLLNWSDEVARGLLGRCAAALRPGGRILVYERDDTAETAANENFTELDLRMLVFLGGRLRTRDEWRSLAAEAGLAVDSVTRIPSPTVPYDLSLLTLTVADND